MMAVGSRQIEVGQLFTLVVASERTLWTKNRGSLTLSGFGDVFQEGAPLDELMLYGQLTSAVHGFFSKLEKQQACMHLSSMLQKNSVIRANPQEAPLSESDSEDSIARRGGRPRLLLLQNEDLCVYRCALACAQFPVLSAPTPPENETPPPAKQQVTQNFNDGIQSNESFPAMSLVETPMTEACDGSEMYSISLPVSLHNDMSTVDMVSREMLCELVRNAFQQSIEQQLRHEQLLRQDFGRHSKGEVLVKELVSQLVVLDNNAHPFYKPKLFISRNGYDVWLQRERRRIKGLVEKFWHYTLPAPSTWIQYNPVDYHQSYVILLEKVLELEYRSMMQSSTVTVHHRSALSPTAQRLLQEFSLRYGVGELYSSLVYLDCLVRKFDYSILHLRILQASLSHVRMLLPHSRNRLVMVKQELDLLKSSIRLLKNHCEYSFTRVVRLFQDSNPVEGIACLIELYQEILEIERGVFGKHSDTMEKSVKKFLKGGFLNQYERQKMLAEHMAQENLLHPHRLSPLLMYSLILGIKDEVQEYRKFQDVFITFANLDVVSLAKVEFYKLLNHDAHSLASKIVAQREDRDSISLPLLALLYRLDELDLVWKPCVTPAMQTWRKPFTDLAIVWMEVLIQQVNDWTLEAINADQWCVLKVQPAAETEMASEHVHVRTASAISLVQSEYSAFADVSLVHGESSVSSLSSVPDQQSSRQCLSVLVQDPQTAQMSPTYSHCLTPQQVSSVLVTESDSVLDTGRRMLRPRIPKDRMSHNYVPAGALMRSDVHCSTYPFKQVKMPSQDAISAPRASAVLFGAHSHSRNSHTPVSVNQSSQSASPLQISQSSTVSSGLNSPTTPAFLVTDATVCPVSPSAFDIFTMLIRTAHFMSSVQNSVIPQSPVADCANPRYGDRLQDLTISRDAMGHLNHLSVEVTLNLKRKLHKAMISAVKLYADNLLCMDLCGLSTDQARSLLGQTMFYYINNRKDSGDIWGCRHDVGSARYANRQGRACPKSDLGHYEPPSASMCIRMNNVQLLLQVWPMLENHMHMVTDIEHETCSIDEASGDVRKDVGFFSKESVNVVQHMKKVHLALVHLVCLKMNSFFKETLLLLLELDLRGYSMDRRLKPLFAYLEKQISLFDHFLIPECNESVKQTFWKYAVKILEDEALKLRLTSTKVMASRASLLLQATLGLLAFLHNKGYGMDIQYLTETAAFVLAVLDLYMKPTSKLLDLFQLLQDSADGSNSADTFLNALKSQLHSVRKSFTGEEFVVAAKDLCGSHLTPGSFLEQLDVPVMNDPCALGRHLLQEGVVELVPSTSTPDSFLNGLYRFCELEDVPTARSASFQLFKVCCSVTGSLCEEVEHTPTTYKAARDHTLTMMHSLLTKRGITSERISRWHPLTDLSWNCLIGF